MDSREPQKAPLTMAGVMDRNIRTLLERRRREDQRKPLQDRLADGITRFTGSMKFVYIHVAVFGTWIAVNLGWIPGIPPFDPTFVMLAMAASVEAIFLSTFVLISQNRMAAIADKRADLDLQISLLAEHEITRLLMLTQAIAEKLKLEQSADPELSELTQDVRPEEVLEHMERTQERGA